MAKMKVLVEVDAAKAGASMQAFARQSADAVSGIETSLKKAESAAKVLEFRSSIAGPAIRRSADVATDSIARASGATELLAGKFGALGAVASTAGFKVLEEGIETISEKGLEAATSAGTLGDKLKGLATAGVTGATGIAAAGAAAIAAGIAVKTMIDRIAELAETFEMHGGMWETLWTGAKVAAGEWTGVSDELVASLDDVTGAGARQNEQLSELAKRLGATVTELREFESGSGAKGLAAIVEHAKQNPEGRIGKAWADMAAPAKQAVQAARDLSAGTEELKKRQDAATKSADEFIKKQAEAIMKAAAEAEKKYRDWLTSLAEADKQFHDARRDMTTKLLADQIAASKAASDKIIADFQRATDVINSTQTAMDISGGEDAERVDIDRKDPAIKAILERLKASAGRASDLGGEHIKGAIDAIKSGNLTLLENLIKASADQAAVLSRLAVPGAAALGQESKGISQMLGSLLMEIRKLLGSPKRAAGGFAMGGRPHIVGERGPELFVPDSSGSVVSNDSMRALWSMPQTMASAVRQAMAEGASRPIVVNIDGRQVASIVNERNTRNEGRRF